MPAAWQVAGYGNKYGAGGRFDDELPFVFAAFARMKCGRWAFYI